MSKVKVSNSFAVKIFLIFFIIAFVIAIIFLSIFVLKKEKDINYFDLGKIDNTIEYSDRIVDSYTELLDILKNYNVTYPVTEEDFISHSFLVVFQDYNPCSESKPKSVSGVSIDDNITVTYKIHSKCGWCERHMVMYILRVEKVDTSKTIDSRYVFPKNQQNCGVIK